MLRITASTSAEGAKKYFGEGLTRSDYYIDGQEVTGQWHGKGAERLGLKGEVDHDAYFALCDNRNPADGSKLTPRDKDNRRVGYDFTFSAPKSVSVLYELSGDQRILDAFRDSVKDTMTEIEQDMKTRVRGRGANEDRVTGEMVAAEFVHFTSRPVNGVPDPHLHAHLYAFNASYDAQEGRWKAGQFGDLKRDATYYEAAFDARLAKRLNDLGRATEKDPKYSFEVAGIPETVIDKFSQRRNLIEKTAAEKGITSSKTKHEITRRGREKKTLDQSKAELRAEWESRLTPDERRAFDDVVAGKGVSSRTVTPAEAMDYAIEHSFVRNSTVSEKRLKAVALQHGVGSVLPDEIQEAMKNRQDVIRIKKDGQRMTTTKDTLNGEIRMLAFAREGRGRFRPLGNVEHLPQGLSAEQGAVAAQTLQSRDQVTGIMGGAGTGKTTTVKAIVGAIERSGKQVHVYAPSADASRGTLRKEGMPGADTLESLLRNQQAQAKVRNDVILVDEAGMVSSKDMGRLFRVAEQQKARVILVGDYRQHGSVEAGDAFRLLESEAGVRYARLKQIRRQEPAEYRRAVEEISTGTREGVRKGFDMLDRSGAIVEVSGSERHAMLVNDYLEGINEKKWVKTPEGMKERNRTGLVIAPTHREGEVLTQELRLALKERGLIGERERKFTIRKSTGWTDAQKKDGRNYQLGMVVEFQQNAKGGFNRGDKAVVAGVVAGQVDLVRQNGSHAVLPDAPARFEVYTTKQQGIAKGERIRITKNDRTLKINNGDIETIDGFTKDGDLRLSNGTVLPKTYGHFDFGYVDTSHKSQSKTVDRVYIAAGDASVLAVNSQQFYVSVSRGRESARVYVDSKADVRDAIAKSGQRMAAVELVKGTKWDRPASEDHLRNTTKKVNRLKEMMERTRVYRYWRERADTFRDGWRNRIDRGREARGRDYAG